MSLELRYNVTDQVDFQNNDDETLPLTKCVCGEVFQPWEQIVGIYPERPWTCPKCGVKLVFSVAIQVYQVQP